MSGSRTPPRLRLITRAPLSAAHRIAATSAFSGTEPSGGDDLRHEQLRVEREAGHPELVERVRRDLAGDERAVALLVRVRRAADEALGRGHPAGELRMRAVDARVDHRDLDGRERRRGRPERPGVVGLEVPLLRRERLGVAERRRAKATGASRSSAAASARTSAPHWSTSGVESPGASPCPGAQRTR